MNNDGVDDIICGAPFFSANFGDRGEISYDTILQ